MKWHSSSTCSIWPERWGAFPGTNPVRMVKFFDEDNDVARVLSLEEEGRLLSHSSPYVQDLILFAIDTDFVPRTF